MRVLVLTESWPNLNKSKNNNDARRPQGSDCPFCTGIGNATADLCIAGTDDKRGKGGGGGGGGGGLHL